MKRHPVLQPLSREHHHALVLARKARRSASKEPGEQTAMWTLIAAAFESQLSRHFDDEERDILPHLADRADLVERTLSDHSRLRELALTGSTPTELAELGELLSEHVRFEERTLFPAFETTLRGR